MEQRPHLGHDGGDSLDPSEECPTVRGGLDSGAAGLLRMFNNSDRIRNLRWSRCFSGKSVTSSSPSVLPGGFRRLDLHGLRGPDEGR